jgi:DNA-binding CsgD family transcriptional regulator
MDTPAFFSQLPFSKLTPRELAVMRCIARGLPSKLIAAELEMTERTVQAHRSRVYEKLGVRSAVALTRLVLHTRTWRLSRKRPNTRPSPQAYARRALRCWLRSRIGVRVDWRGAGFGPSFGR